MIRHLNRQKDNQTYQLIGEMAKKEIIIKLVSTL